MLRELSSTRRSFLFQIPGRHKPSWTNALRSTMTDDANRPLPVHQTVCSGSTHPTAGPEAFICTPLRPSRQQDDDTPLIQRHPATPGGVVVYTQGVGSILASDSAEDLLPALCQAYPSPSAQPHVSHTLTALHGCLSLKLDTSGSCPDFIPSHIIYIYIPPAAVQSGHAPVVNHRDGHC